MRKTLVCVFSLLTIALLLTTAPLWGQTNTGVITGVVTDQAGAVIPAAKVTITSQTTGVSTVFTADSQGYFTSPPINPNTYSVTVTASGFQSQTQADIVLRVQDRLNLNFKMAIGQVTQNVTVTNATPTINTQTSSLGQVVSASTITAMPLNGRSYVELAGLSTGVIETAVGSKSQTNGLTSGSSGFVGQVTFDSNGARGDVNNFLLDGIDNNSNDEGGIVFNTQVDALQEFKIQTSSYSAEFGRSGGAVINAITKSGTNAYHGNVFEFNRNTVFDARNYFQPASTGPKTAYKQNQYGGTFGGPIIRNKLFWFGDFQATSIDNPVPLISTVPVGAARTGNFTSSSYGTIYDPNTYNPTTNTRTPFPGNIIPANRIVPISQAFVNLYPAPNLPGDVNNYEITPAAPYLGLQGDFRGDYDPSQKDQGFFRFSDGSLNSVGPQRFPGLAQGQSGGNVNIGYIGAALGETHIFSPALVNEFRLGFSYYGGHQEFPPYGISYPPADLLIPGLTLSPKTAGLAQFSPSGYTGLGMSGYDPTYLSTEERQITDALNMTHGKHSIVMGFEVRWSQFNLFQVPNPDGLFNFSGQFTQNPADGSGGDGLADALLGLPLTSTYNTTDFRVQNRQRVPSAFVQDDYKVTPTFTLNLGLRYDYFSPVVAKHNQQANFNFVTQQLYLAGVDGNSRALTKADHLNFGPRIGFAKTIHKNTVISAGGGIFWTGQEVRESGQLAYNTPFEYGPTFTSDGITPIITMSGGFPPFNPNQETDPGVTSLDNPHLDTPRYSHYNLSIQQALPGRMSLQLAYAGGKGTHLQSDLDYNQDKVPGPGDVQTRRPYPNFGPFTGTSDRANSKYYSFQAKLEKQAGNGLYFLSSFTWSKAYDDQDGYPLPQNSWDIPAEEGLANFNQTLRWVLSYDYLLPFGTGQRLLGGANHFLNEVVGGWHFGGIYTLGSGFPLTPAMGYDTSNTGSQGDVRPDQILPDGNFPRSRRSPALWFNTSAYAIPAQYTFGDAGRNTLIGPDRNEWDLSLNKTFAIRESQHLEFRSEFFNSLNHPQFAQPDPYITNGPGAFGVITSTGLDNREIQLALKYSF